MNRETLKQIFISVLVGALTSFLVSFLSGLLEVVQSWQTETVGPVIGMSRYIYAWRTGRTG